MTHFTVLAFFDPVARVWLKPFPFTRPATARDYVMPHVRRGGALPVLGTTMAGEVMPYQQEWNAERYARALGMYLVVGIPIDVDDKFDQGVS